MALAVLETLALLLLLAGTLFAAAGTWRWGMAWAFLGVYAAFAVVAFLVLSPSLVAERSRLIRRGARHDVALSAAFAFLLYAGTLAACGLDRRFGGSPPVPTLVQVMALGLFAAGYDFSLWAMRTNRFFSTVIRIQSERGHVLVDRGPYRWMRHPGYAGAVLAHMVLPIALGSLWGLAPAALGCALLALRIRGEERVLQSGLAGYSEYMARVRWRLIPGIW